MHFATNPGLRVERYRDQISWIDVWRANSWSVPEGLANGVIDKVEQCHHLLKAGGDFEE